MATPLERQFSQIPGVGEMTSTSVYGNTSITLQFDWSATSTPRPRTCSPAINAAGGQLPTNLPSPPVVHKVNPTTQRCSAST